MEIESVLCEPPQGIHRHLIRAEESGQEFSVTAAVREIRKSELAPGADAPMAISVIDYFYRDAIRPGEIFVKGRGSSERPQSRRVFGEFPIERHSAQREMVVTNGRTRSAVFTPISIFCLFRGREAVKNFCPQALPLSVSEDSSSKQQIRGPQRVMIRRSACVWRVIPGEIVSFSRVWHDQCDIFLNAALPACTALFPQFPLEQPPGLEPHVSIPIAIEPWRESAALMFIGQQITNPDRQRTHPGIAIAVVARMAPAV